MTGIPIGKRRWTAFLAGVGAWLAVMITAQFKGAPGIDSASAAAFGAICASYFGSKFAEKGQA